MNQIEFALRGEFITLDALLKATGLAGSGGAAKAMVAEGRVQVDGREELRTKNAPDTPLTDSLGVGGHQQLLQGRPPSADAAQGGKGRVPRCRDAQVQQGGTPGGPRVHVPVRARPEGQARRAALSWREAGTRAGTQEDVRPPGAEAGEGGQLGHQLEEEPGRHGGEGDDRDTHDFLRLEATSAVCLQVGKPRQARKAPRAPFRCTMSRPHLGHAAPAFRAWARALTSTVKVQVG